MALKKDIEATRAQHFEDWRSYITPDGREVLYGKDWEARKYMVWCRTSGRCEHPKCHTAMTDVHHKIKRSEKRDDRLENLEGLCRLHHNLNHPEKQPRWSVKSSV